MLCFPGFEVHSGPWLECFCVKPYRALSCRGSASGRCERAFVSMGAGGSAAKSAADKINNASIEELKHSVEELSADERARVTESLGLTPDASIEELKRAFEGLSADERARVVASLEVTALSLAERIAAPVYYPFRWEEAAEAVRQCDGGATLTLPKMIELSAALLDIPSLKTVEITGGSDDLLKSHKDLFGKEGYSERFRELLRAEKRARLSQLASL